MFKKLFKLVMIAGIIYAVIWFGMMAYASLNLLPVFQDSNITVKDIFSSDIDQEKKDAIVKQAEEAGAELGRKVGQGLFSIFRDNDKSPETILGCRGE